MPTAGRPHPDADAADVAARWTQLLAQGEGRADLVDEDETDRLVHELARQGDEVVLRLGLDALSHPDPWHRQAAARVLGELGFPQGRPFGDRVAPALLRAARSEHDDDVRATLVNALGSAEDAAYLDDLLSFADDRAAGVREVVAAAVPLLSGCSIPPRGIDAIVVLTTDDDARVRDWATFSLGTQAWQDSPAVRAALAARLDDDDADAAAEALLGLARRADPRALSRVRVALETRESVDLLLLEAAAEVADPDLLPALSGLARAWAGDDNRFTQALDFALARCDPAAAAAAARFEQQVVTAVDAAVAGTGWSLALTGVYPGTLLWRRRPDGAIEETDGPERLWDATIPVTVDVAPVVAHWVDELTSAARRR